MILYAARKIKELKNLNYEIQIKIAAPKIQYRVIFLLLGFTLRSIEKLKDVKSKN